ncbi:hypothetical protein Agabi119p4_3283 [Agaricus bisporus var. burnettii]|uniref:Kinesin light chain n=1 Tax=Agaricus bisporus var. burnettii TaxID=192524 RepID=A0A8H7F6Z5_AGABI|nr:hypothetical protein Agabi119p4_3283 [Agaricus bisporus var. burnettii]
MSSGTRNSQSRSTFWAFPCENLEGPPLRLLALDGGGIRGLSELLVLKEVMHQLMGVLSGLALVYSEKGQWKEAEALQVMVVEKRKRLLGDDHPHTLTSMGNLALTYWNLGQRKEAEELEVMMEKRQQLSDDDYDC